MTSEFDSNILGKYCVIFLSNTDQAIMFKGKQLNMSATVEGMVVNTTDEHLFLSEGKDETVTKIIPKKSIGYIHIEPKVGVTDFMDFMEFDDTEDGDMH